jgi:hypothetical protein
MTTYKTYCLELATNERAADLFRENHQYKVQHYPTIGYVMECSRPRYYACFFNANFRICVLAVSRFQRTGWPISSTSPIVFTTLFSIMLGRTRTQLLRYSIHNVHGRTNERTDRHVLWFYAPWAKNALYEEGKNGLDRKKEQKGKNKNCHGPVISAPASNSVRKPILNWGF